MIATRPPAPFVGGLWIALVVVAGVIIATTGRGLPLGPEQSWHEFLHAHHNPAADAIARFLNIAGGILSMTIVTIIAAVGLAIRQHFTAAVSVEY